MKRILTFLFMVSGTSSGLFAQDNQHKHGCHVYVVDVAFVSKLADRYEDLCLKDRTKCGVTEFPNFIPTFGEEVDTIKSYKFPGANYTITAGVYFTDESLASASGADSVLLSIRVAEKTSTTERADEHSAQAEFAQATGAEAMRVKRYYRLGGKRYLVGMECQFKEIK